MASLNEFERQTLFFEGQFQGLCTPAEFAEYFGIDESTIRHAIKSGRLRQGIDCLKMGKQWILARSAWDRWEGDWSSYSKLKIKYNQARQNPTESA